MRAVEEWMPRDEEKNWEKKIETWKKYKITEFDFFESIQNCIAFQSNIIFNTGI